MYDRIPLPPADNPWLIQLSQALEVANQAHAACDDAAPVAERLAIDRALQVAVNTLENNLKPKDFIGNQATQDALKQVRTILSERLQHAAAPLQLANEPITPLSRVISILPELQAQRLMDALFIVDATARNDALKVIFDPPDISAPALEWQQYIATHSFGSRLGSNSISFKVSGANDPPEILKVEYRMGNSRYMDGVVREALPDLITPISACRLLVGPGIPAKNLSQTARTLMVTTFCEEGGAPDYAQRLRDEHAQRPKDDTTFLSQTLNIAQQMCAAFLKLEKKNLYFPDAKLANWLVEAPAAANALPKLRNADTKCILRCAPDALIDFDNEPENADAVLIASSGYYSGEVFGRLTPPQSIHAGIFGRNLYIFLTGKTPSPDNITLCTEEVFQTEPGRVFSMIIQSLTTIPAHKRVAMVEIYQALNELEILLDPRLSLIKDKRKEIEALLGNDNLLLDHFHETIAEFCSDEDFNLDEAFLALDQYLDGILASVKAIQARHQSIDTSAITLNGYSVFPKSLIEEDLQASFKSATDLSTLADELVLHNQLLDKLEASMASLEELEDLRNTALDQSFGEEDSEMESFLDGLEKETFQCKDLSEALANAESIHDLLSSLSNEPPDPTIKEIRRLIEDLPNTQGTEAKAIKALREAITAVPVELRGDLKSNQANSAVVALSDALSWVRVTRDPAFNAITEKMQALNDLTGLENGLRLFSSLKKTSNHSVETSEALSRLDALVTKALATAREMQRLRMDIRALPTVYVDGNKLFPGRILSGDKLACCTFNIGSIEALITGLEEHVSHLSELKKVIVVGLPEQFKTQMEYLRSQQDSTNDQTMKDTLDKYLDCILNEEDLNIRLNVLMDTVSSLNKQIEEFDRQHLTIRYTQQE